MVMLGVLLFALALRSIIGSKRQEVLDRLEREVGGPGRGLPLEVDGGRLGAQSGGFTSVAARAAGQLGRIARPQEQEKVSRYKERLSQAGFRQPNAVEIFFGARILIALLCAAFALWLLAKGNFSTGQAIFIASVLILIGILYPHAWLDGRIKERQKELNRMLPDAMDLIVICVEAGLSMDQAINRVGQEISRSSPLLAKELTQTGLEIEAGVGRAEAFRKLAARTGIEDLRILAAMIIQSEQFGTSIAKSLRLQSQTMRLRRMQKLEELAAKIPARMTIPLIMFILPALFTVIMGPAVVRIYHIFAGQ